LTTKNLFLGVTIVLGGLIGIGTMFPMSVSAVTINCAGIVIPDVCSGTTRNDVMTGDKNDNFICGRSGYDKIILGGGSDTGVGNGGLVGGDVIDGGYGKDTIMGDNINSPGAPEDCGGQSSGADNLNGGPDDDKIFHSGIISPTASDGFKDIINCGPGKDEAFINIRVDADIAIDCESVHAG
jgi:Ca2+-binding RTX toxin-like protein